MNLTFVARAPDRMQKQEPQRMSSREKLTTKSRRSAAVSPPSVQAAPDASGTAAPVETSKQRHERIAVKAYYLAAARGFTPGAELDDWLAAEAQVDGDPIEAAPGAEAG